MGWRWSQGGHWAAASVCSADWHSVGGPHDGSRFAATSFTGEQHDTTAEGACVHLRVGVMYFAAASPSFHQWLSPVTTSASLPDLAATKIKDRAKKKRKAYPGRIGNKRKQRTEKKRQTPVPCPERKPNQSPLCQAHDASCGGCVGTVVTHWRVLLQPGLPPRALVATQDEAHPRALTGLGRLLLDDGADAGLHQYLDTALALCE